MRLKKGQLVRVIKVPDATVDGPELKTKTLIEQCLEKSFPIAGFHRGFIAIDVGELEGKASYLVTLYLEPFCVELAANSLLAST